MVMFNMYKLRTGNKSITGLNKEGQFYHAQCWDFVTSQKFEWKSWVLIKVSEILVDVVKWFT